MPASLPPGSPPRVNRSADPASAGRRVPGSLGRWTTTSGRLAADLTERLLDRHGRRSWPWACTARWPEATTARRPASTWPWSPPAPRSRCPTATYLRDPGLVVDLAAIGADAYLEEASSIGPAWPLAADQYVNHLAVHDPGGYFHKLKHVHEAAVEEAGPRCSRPRPPSTWSTCSPGRPGRAPPSWPVTCSPPRWRSRRRRSWPRWSSASTPGPPTATRPTPSCHRHHRGRRPRLRRGLPPPARPHRRAGRPGPGPRPGPRRPPRAGRPRGHPLPGGRAGRVPVGGLSRPGAP